MRDASRNGFESPLNRQAILYASGELDARQAASFEDRLGNDQEAREALCLAAPIAVKPAGDAPLRPGRAYRKQVHARLHNGAIGWHALWAKRAYRGHPVAWALTGAVAAVVLTLGFSASPCP